MNYALEQRLRFIDLLLSEYGTLNRRVIMDYFGMSQPQATLDIREYLTRAPDNAVYDKTARTYRRTDQFKRVWA